MSEGGQQTQEKASYQQQDRGERPPRNTTKLQIANLRDANTVDDIKELCRRFGQTTQIVIAGSNGFVTFSKPDEAQLALYSLNGQNYHGFQLRVSFAREPKTGKLHIGNLRPNTLEADLNEFCRRFGQISKVEINGTNGFVTYTKPDDAQIAFYSLNGQPFHGSLLKVSFGKDETLTTQQKDEEEKKKQQEQKQQAELKKQQEAQAKVERPEPVRFSAQQQLVKTAKPKQQPQQQPKPQPEKIYTPSKPVVKKGVQATPVVSPQTRRYRVFVQTEGDQNTDQPFSMGISHEQYEQYIVPLMQAVQAQQKESNQQS